jgi:uncharacterized membrane protein
MRAIVVWVIGFFCGFGLMAFFHAKRIEQIERWHHDAQSELASLRGVMAWRDDLK